MADTVLNLIDTLAVGGTERSLLEIAARLRRHQPMVCTVYRGDQHVPAFLAAGSLIPHDSPVAACFRGRNVLAFPGGGGAALLARVRGVWRP